MHYSYNEFIANVSLIDGDIHNVKEIQNIFLQLKNAVIEKLSM